MKNPRGAAPKPENNDDCRVLAPFVMTLFDGEADEIEARRARAHLLICQSCANRWLDWNRSRDLLRLSPVPAPPPQLLWRVLMACRLVAAPRRAAERSARADSTTSNYPTQRAASNAPEIAAPANFSAQILARTTQAPSRKIATLPASIQPLPTSTSRANFSFRLPISSLKMPALALPALAAWMMVLQRDVWLPVPLAATSADTSRVVDAPRRAQKSPVAVPISSKRLAPHAVLGAASSTAQTAASSPLAPAALPPADTAEVDAAPRSSRSRAVAMTALPGAPVMRAIEASFGLRANTDFERAAPPENWEAPQSAATEEAENEVLEVRRAPRHTPRRAVRVHLAALSNPKNAPHLRTAGWQSAPVLSAAKDANNSPTGRGNSATTRGAMNAPAAPQMLRVSLPSAHAPQPARLLAENFDADDQRVEEIRSVVDDFRATLGPDDTGTESTSAPGEGDGDGLG